MNPINPLFQQFIGALLRWALTFAGAWFVSKGVLTQGQTDEMIAGAVVAGVTLGWVLYLKYKDRLKLLTALSAQKGSTEHQVEAMVREGKAPPVTTQKSDVPKASPKTS